MSESPETPEPSDSVDEISNIEVRCYFVRERNVLLTRAEFSDLFTDHYIHLMENKIRHSAENDQLLKDALAAMTLHLASRPRNETTAWTMNFTDPPANLFAVGSSKSGNVVARLSTEDVKVGDHNMFYAQVAREDEGTRQSTVGFGGHDVFSAVESYYQQSEQRPAAYFHVDVEDVVMITAQPDCDLEWFLNLDDEQVKKIDQEESLSLLETRSYHYGCGCSLDRIYPIIAAMSAGSVDEVFAGQETANASCPRCGARYRMTREGLEAHISEQEDV
ncbi:MAG: Hsp33 family molecular chaperone HslO [Verrucomicrobiales bacterium]|nr:Hsp33 family molecular chaperone HslO [Verrucomicrobiales bacterium]